MDVLFQEKLMRTISVVYGIVFGSIILVGCAVTPMSPAARNVRVISGRQAHRCHFLDHVSTNNTNTLNKDPQQDARNRALNRVAELGGNALRITSTSTEIAPSGLGSIFRLSGEAYSCK